jgi:nucleoid-associated protein YgaU
MISVTIQVGDAAEMRRLADVLAAHFCRVQGEAVRADSAQLELPVTPATVELPIPATAAERVEHEDKATVKKRTAAERKAKKAADAAAPEPAPAETPKSMDISNENIVAAVRGAMRGEGGIPAVRKALDDLGLKTALDASDEQRPALIAALTALATSDGN